MVYNPRAKKKTIDQMNQEGSSRQGSVVISEPLAVEELSESPQMPITQVQSPRPRSQKTAKGKTKKGNCPILYISVCLRTLPIHLICALQQFLNQLARLLRELGRTDWKISKFRR